MKKLSAKLLAVALAFVTVFTMSGVSTTVEAATKQKVEVQYTGSKTKKASVKSISVSVDGDKASKKATIYLSGKKKVKVSTAVTVTVKGTADQKLKATRA